MFVHYLLDSLYTFLSKPITKTLQKTLKQIFEKKINK